MVTCIFSWSFNLLPRRENTTVPNFYSVKEPKEL
ncbi:hypothetical protein C5167_048726 [Papaver somniferum]|uniref:Uncharacterized protein n=1 Tax=Papaver somniferum TaxID=3469 RepID=A0A4Y7KIR9_PAPSO|nr:hypothetical protein C5167_048726 [Papaver somniferum]